MMLFGLLPFAGLILFVFLVRGIGAMAAGTRSSSGHGRSAGLGCGMSTGYGDEDSNEPLGVSDSDLFRLAGQNRGHLTLSDVVVDTGMTLKEAEQRMNGLADGVHVNMAVQDDGTVLYEFPELTNRTSPLSLPAGRPFASAQPVRRRNGFGGC